MAKLFLDGIFEDGSQSPSSVKIKLSGKENFSLVGLMMSDPTFSTQNKWGPVINDVSNLQDLFSLTEMNMASWVAASTMCWKGTSPLVVGIEFYLINYKKGLNIETHLKELVKLTAIKAEGSVFVSVHGGYKPKILQDNNAKNALTSYFNGQVKSLAEVDLSSTPISGEENTVSLQFGNKFKIENLLTLKVDITGSNVEVADKNGGDRKPLYYRVSAQFTGAKPLLTSDVDSIFVKY